MNGKIYTTLGASNHTDKVRDEHDYYATSPIAAELLLEQEDFTRILEPACGEGHLSKVFKDKGIETLSTDLIYRGYGISKDFFEYRNWDGDVVTNPPYKYAYEFITHALNIIPDGRKVAMFLKVQFLEGRKRKKLFQEHPPRTVYVSSSRILCAKNAEFEKMKAGGGSALAYAWFLWVKGYQGDTVIKWIN